MEKNIFGIWCGKIGFDKEHYKKEFERLLKEKSGRKFLIKKSSAAFKINKFSKKGTGSLELAEFVKNSDKKAKDYWYAFNDEVLMMKVGKKKAGNLLDGKQYLEYPGE